MIIHDYYKIITRLLVDYYKIIKNAGKMPGRKEGRKEGEVSHIYNQPAGRLVPSSDYKHMYW